MDLLKNKIMKKIKLIDALLGICLIAMIVTGLIGLTHKTPTALGDINANPIYAPANNTGILCANTSTLLIATSTSRNMLVVSGDSIHTVYLSLGTPAVMDQGIVLNASSSVIFDSTRLFAGAIYCISSTNASTTLSESK